MGNPGNCFYSSVFQIQLRCSVHLSMKWIFKNAQRETPPRYCSQSTRLRSQQVSTSLRSTRLYKSLQVLRLCKSLLHKKVSVCALRIFPHHVNCLQSRRLHLCTQICGETVNLACQIWFCKKTEKIVRQIWTCENCGNSVPDLRHTVGKPNAMSARRKDKDKETMPQRF